MHIGVLINGIKTLEFFENGERIKERIEDINELRFIEHGWKLKMIETYAEMLSVDTLKDLEYVKCVMRGNHKLMIKNNSTIHICLCIICEW